METGKKYRLGRKSNEEVFVENSTYPRHKIKDRIIKQGLLEYKCCECGNTGSWNGKKLVLQLDHINGKNDDHRLENLDFVCPNCHTQTDTFCAKNHNNSKRNTNFRLYYKNRNMV